MNIIVVFFCSRVGPEDPYIRSARHVSSEGSTEVLGRTCCCYLFPCSTCCQKGKKQNKIVSSEFKSCGASEFICVPLFRLKSPRVVYVISQNTSNRKETQNIIVHIQLNSEFPTPTWGFARMRWDW